MSVIKVKPIMESLDYILTHKCSVARFGDGEMDIIAGYGIPYQDYDEHLAAQLREIVGQESSEAFLVCLSDVFEGRERYNSNFAFFWNKHLERFAHLYEDICRAPWYGSTFISRPYIDLEDKVPAAESFAKLKQIWQGQDVLIVEGETSRSGVGNDLFASAKSVSRIICPSRNAYTHYDEIAQAIRQHGQDKLVLLMLGPTAKVLSYNLAKEGFWTIDLGHIDSEYEWFRMGATQKVKLGHKHTAEHNYDEGIELSVDEGYVQQIVARVPDCQPLISVLIPVYNVDAYLDECVQSALGQTYTNLEIVLINDGSTDQSGVICDRYAREDDRVRVFHQENRGASSAKNRAVRAAKGEWVTILDSDDVLKEPDMLTILYKQAQRYQADLVIGNYFEYDQNDGKFYYRNLDKDFVIEVVTSQEAIDRQANWGHLNTSAFVITAGKLIHRTLFEGIEFPEGRMFDDEFVTHKLYMKAQRIVLVNGNYYLYRRGHASVMNSGYSLKRVQDLIGVFQEKLTDLVLAGYDTTQTRLRYRNVLKDYQGVMAYCGLVDSQEYRLISHKIDLIEQADGRGENE